MSHAEAYALQDSRITTSLWLTSPSGIGNRSSKQRQHAVRIPAPDVEYAVSTGALSSSRGARNQRRLDLEMSDSADSCTHDRSADWWEPCGFPFGLPQVVW